MFFENRKCSFFEVFEKVFDELCFHCSAIGRKADSKICENRDCVGNGVSGLVSLLTF